MDAESLSDQINCNIPEVTPNQMKRILRRYRNSEKSFYIEGEPGVGKSFLVNEMAEEEDMDMIDRRAAGWLPDTAGGTLMQDVASRSTIWYPPEWLQIDNGRARCFCFDEFSAADDRVRKPLFGFFLERRLNDIKVRKNDLLVALGNVGDFGTIVQYMDNATRGRFLNYRIKTSLQDWLQDFAAIYNVHPAVVAYLKLNSGYFLMTEYAMNNPGMIAYGNPRNWTTVSDLIWDTLESCGGVLDKEVRQELLWAAAGSVGVALATGVVSMLEQVQQGHTLVDLLEASPSARAAMWPKDLGQLHALLHSMMSYPTTVEQGLQIMELTKEFPVGTDLQFQDMKSPVQEVILQRLRKRGIASDVISRHFGADAGLAMRPMLNSGRALVNLRAAA